MSKLVQIPFGGFYESIFTQSLDILGSKPNKPLAISTMQ